MLPRDPAIRKQLAELQVIRTRLALPENRQKLLDELARLDTSDESLPDLAPWKDVQLELDFGIVAHAVAPDQVYAAPKKRYKHHQKNASPFYWRAIIYGVSVEFIEQMLEHQHNACAICCQPFPSLSAIELDHSHKTGKVRGLLCRRCNLGLRYFDEQPEMWFLLAQGDLAVPGAGAFDRDPVLFQRAGEYLKQAQQSDSAA